MVEDFGRKCLLFSSPPPKKKQLSPSSWHVNHAEVLGLVVRGGYTLLISFDLNKLFNQMKVSPFPSLSLPPLTTEHTVANESTDGCYWNGLIIFMCSWKYHWVRWRRFWLFIAPCSLKLCFYVNVRVTVAVKTTRACIPLKRKNGFFCFP